MVDEAHCIKLWGEDFRQTFSEIGNIRCLIPSGVNVMALTATATSETYHCALIQLAMTDRVLVALPPDRSNIRYSVKPATTLATLSDELSSQLCDFSKEFPKTVLLYEGTNTVQIYMPISAIEALKNFSRDKVMTLLMLQFCKRSLV